MKTILLVDDDDLIVEALSDLLSDQGYRVMSAENGAAGFSRMEKERPDLVITDYMMPFVDGAELVLAMRACPKCRSIPVLMISSAPIAGALANTQEGAVLKISAFLRKPFSADELLDVVAQLIGNGETEGACADAECLAR